MAKEFKLKSSLFDRNRRLILTKDYLEYENKDLKSDLFSRLEKVDIIDFKHEFEKLIFYRFPIGNKFSISFLDKKNQVMKVKFKEYFWNSSNYAKIYSELINIIWEYYFFDIVNSYYDKYKNNGSLNFKDVRITQSGINLISINKSIAWAYVKYTQYYTYFVIYDAQNSNVYHRISFDEWNAEIIFSLIRTIQKHLK